MKASALLISAVSARSLIEQYGMTELAAPFDDGLIQLQGEGGWNNKPWKTGGYKWDQSNLETIYSVPDAHSYIKQYDTREFAWNDAQHDQSDEVKWLANTNTLSSDYMENTLPSAEYHLRNGRTGVPETADFSV